MTLRKEIPTALWKRIESLIPQIKRSPKGGRSRINDQHALDGIVYVLRTGVPWEYLPAELGYGSGMACWRRLRDWQAAGVWHRLHQVLLAKLRRADALDLGRASLDVARSSAASSRASHAKGSSATTDLAVIAGLSSVPTPGSQAWENDAYASSAVSISIWRCSRLHAPSSAYDFFPSFVSRA